MSAIHSPVRGVCCALTLAFAAGCAPDPAVETDNPFVGAWSLFDGPDRLLLSTEPDPARGGGAVGTLVRERVSGR